MADLKNYVPGLGQGIVVTSRDTDPQFGQFISVTLGTASIYGMNGAPANIIPAAGANTAIVVTDAIIDVAAGTAYAAGGATGLTYTGSATYIAGTVGSAAFYGATGTTVYLLTSNNYQIPSNTGVFLTNSGAAYTTGTEAVTVNVWYAVVPVSH